jgi:ABC-2 type transport system permease protein
VASVRRRSLLTVYPLGFEDRMAYSRQVMGLLLQTRAALKAQWAMSLRNPVDAMPLLTIPLTAVISAAVVEAAGRPDLRGYALVACVLMTMGQMAFFVAGEVLAGDRRLKVFELLLASPAAYLALLTARMSLLTAFGSLGLIEGYFLVAWIAGPVEVHHWGVLVATLCVTAASFTLTALVVGAWMCSGRSTRTVQHIVSGPIYLLGGVLVPASLLPSLIQPVSDLLFLSWSADLMRDTLHAAPIEAVPFRLAAVALLGVLGGCIGYVWIGRMIERLRRDGTVSL